jgi:hypothetical protein
MQSPAVDIKDMIVAAGLGVFATNLFIASMPQDPDLCIAVYDIAGLSAELNYEWQFPAVQVQVRGARTGIYTDAYNEINAIAALLHGKQETRGGVNYKLIQQEGDISHVSTDEYRRPLLTTRFQIQRTTA